MQLKTLMPDIYTLIPSDYASIRCREYERLLSLYMSRAVPSAHPRFVQVGGIPGAGKSTFCAGRRWNDRLFISQSPFEKRFRKVVGTSPKKFASIVRFNAVLNNLNTTKSLAQLCYENNFFDQAHFIKDFKQFTGETPENFKRFL